MLTKYGRWVTKEDRDFLFISKKSFANKLHDFRSETYLIGISTAGEPVVGEVKDCHSFKGPTL